MINFETLDPKFLIFLSSILGGIFSSVVTFFALKNKANNERIRNENEGFDILRKSFIDEFTRMKNSIEESKKAEVECLVRYEELEKEFKKLKYAFQIHKNSYPDLPIPLWKKDMNGTMLALNDAYEREFLEPMGKTREDYIGSTDAEIWGSGVALELTRNDKKVKNRGDLVRFVEELPIGLSKEKRKYEIIKYPEKIDGIIVCISGMALPFKEK